MHIDSAPSGVRLSPDEGSNIFRVVKDFLGKNNSIPNRRVVIDLKKWRNVPNELLDRESLKSMATAFNVTLEVHSLTADGDVKVEEFLST